MKTSTLTIPKIALSTLVAVGFVTLGVFGLSALFAHADTGPSITTTIRDSGNTAVSSAAIGTMVHASTTLASTTSAVVPTGTVNFSRYANLSCSGTPTFESGIALVNGTAQSGAVALPANGLSYLVGYSGDANNTAGTSTCVSVTPTSATVALSTALSTTSASVLTGSVISDSATLSNVTGSAGGSVSYKVYTDNACTVATSTAGVKTVTNGVVPNSDPVTFNIPGTFYWQAVYSGDAQNSAATSSCSSEVITVTNPVVTPPTVSGSITGNIFNDVNKNDVKDAGDTNLAGWNVWLHQGKNYGDPIIMTATSDANGNYSFGTLAAGTYFVEEQVEPGWKQTSDDMKVVIGSNNQAATVNFANIMKNASTTNQGHHDNENDGDHDDNGMASSTDHGHGNQNGNDNDHGNNGNHWGWFNNFFHRGDN